MSSRGYIASQFVVSWVCCVIAAVLHCTCPETRAHPSQAAENNSTIREAATRIFSNASGSYSSNVNLAIENSSWSDEQQLQEMYMARKSFAFNSDRCATSFPLNWFVQALDLATPGKHIHRQSLQLSRPLALL